MSLYGRPLFGDWLLATLRSVATAMVSLGSHPCGETVAERSRLVVALGEADVVRGCRGRWRQHGRRVPRLPINLAAGPFDTTLRFQALPMVEYGPLPKRKLRRQFPGPF